jgi:proteasome accessory factor B
MPAMIKNRVCQLAAYPQKYLKKQIRPETPQNRPQYHRLRRIIALVRDGMAGGRLPNRSDFRRELEVSPRTLARDLDFLRDEERAPIAYEPARHGYRLTDATYDLPPVNLSRREVFSFSLARKMLHAFEGTPLEMDMRSTLDKIAESLEGTFAVSLDALTEHMSVQAEDRVVVDPGIWEAVARAIECRDVLRADYRRFDGKCSTYEIEPLHLLAYHGNWYVLARSRGSEKTFALSRFGKVAPTGKHFKRPAGFDWRSFSREAFGIAHGEKPERIRLLFSANVATYIRERVWHPSQILRPHRDGSLEMRLETSGHKELVRWVLSWMPDVRVLAPKSLRVNIARKLAEGMRRNAGNDRAREGG